MDNNTKSVVCQDCETDENLTDTRFSEKKRTYIEKPWRKSKNLSRHLSDLYEHLCDKSESAKDKKRLFNKSERTFFCGDYLKFAVKDGLKKLAFANFCKDRLCPMCTWRKSVKVGSEVKKVVDYLDGQYRYVMLTLTVRNCLDSELGDTLDVLLKGFNAFVKYKECKPFKGFFRGLEVKRSEDTRFDWHPHIHVLLAVRPSYFHGEGYLKHERLRELWQRAIKSEYLPQCNVVAVKGNTGRAVCEVAKYSVKGDEYIYPQNLDLSEQLVALLDKVLKGRRFAAWGGVLAKARKEIISDEEAEDLTDGVIEDEETHYEYYRWNIGVTNYRRLNERGEKFTEDMWSARKRQFDEWNERRRAGK